VRSERWRGAAATVLLVALTWTQIGAPDYDPSAYLPLNVSPRYDELFRQAGNLSEDVFHEAMWFEREMDSIANDAAASFVSVGGWSGPITGLYAPHVTGRIMYASPTNELSSLEIDQIRSGARPIVAVYGDASRVGEVADNMTRRAGVGTLLLDAAPEGPLQYRLMVFAMPDFASLPFTWAGTSLPRINGVAKGSTVVAEPPGASGFITYGPYMPLKRGNYRVTLRYRATSDGADVGTFDVADATESIKSAPIVSSAGRSSSVSLSFSVVDDSSAWEFRTQWSGTGTLIVESLTLSKE
jgi:hypothetical protein